MAINRITELERKYFARKAGAAATPTTPLNQLKRRQMIAVVGATTPGERIDLLETRWLQKLAQTAGYTPAQDYRGLWSQAVASLSKTPAKTVNDNKIIFYTFAP